MLGLTLLTIGLWMLKPSSTNRSNNSPPKFSRVRSRKTQQTIKTRTSPIWN
jgi:hypothetical protein